MWLPDGAAPLPARLWACGSTERLPRTRAGVVPVGRLAEGVVHQCEQTRREDDRGTHRSGPAPRKTGLGNRTLASGASLAAPAESERFPQPRAGVTPPSLMWLPERRHPALGALADLPNIYRERAQTVVPAPGAALRTRRVGPVDLIARKPYRGLSAAK